MGIVNDFMRLMRKDEYDAQDAAEAVLREEADANRAALLDRIQKNDLPIKRMNYRLAIEKAVIVECVSRLYMGSLIIEDANQYKDSLLPVARREVVKALNEFTDIDSLYAHINNASPYVKAMLPLAEAIADAKVDDDEKVQEFDQKVVLDAKDVALINEWEKDNGKDIYAGVIQDRIVDVCKAEEEANLAQKEKVQAVVDALSEKNSEGENAVIDGEEVVQESAIRGALNVFDNEPKSIFNAIFVNKTKQILNEAGTGVTVKDYADDIFCETVCTYTLLECIHSLGIKTYSDEDKLRLRYEFITA